MNRSKLTKKELQELVLNLCISLCNLKKPTEVAEALTDLLSAKEVETIAKRLKIAELLIKNYNYAQIRGSLKVGFSTIARVNTWLGLSGRGYKILLTTKYKLETKTESNEEKYDPYSFHNFKRRYSLYFWPQLLLEELIKSSNKKEKLKIIQIIEKLNIKSSTFKKETNKELFNSFTGKLHV